MSHHSSVSISPPLALGPQKSLIQYKTNTLCYKCITRTVPYICVTVFNITHTLPSSALCGFWYWLSVSRFGLVPDFPLLFPVPFLSSVPLYGMTYPFLSPGGDRNTPWTRSTQTPRHSFPETIDLPMFSDPCSCVFFSTACLCCPLVCKFCIVSILVCAGACVVCVLYLWTRFCAVKNVIIKKRALRLEHTHTALTHTQMRPCGHARTHTHSLSLSLSHEKERQWVSVM